MKSTDLSTENIKQENLIIFLSLFFLHYSWPASVVMVCLHLNRLSSLQILLKTENVFSQKTFQSWSLESKCVNSVQYIDVSCILQEMFSLLSSPHNHNALGLISPVSIWSAFSLTRPPLSPLAVTQCIFYYKQAKSCSGSTEYMSDT